MDKIKFNKENHTYKLIKDNGEKIDLVSVTTLLKKHGISPDYTNVSEEVLKAKAERGTVIHEELERYINHKEIGFTNELENFMELCSLKKIFPSKSEFMVWNDEIAGTVDVAGIIDGQTFIGDFKTTATIHRESVAWQLRLYAFLMNEHFDRYLCFHFDNEGKCKIVDLKPIPTEQIEELLRCERNSELYQKHNLEIDIVQCEKILAIQNELKEIKNRKEILEAEEEEFKNLLIQKMEESGVKQIDNDYFKITYVEPTTRETIDSKRLKREKPKIAAEFTCITPIKASVRIKLKGV